MVIFFARERESFLGAFFSRVSAQKKLVFFPLFWCFCADGSAILCFLGVFLVFRALARKNVFGFFSVLLELFFALIQKSREFPPCMP